MKKNRTSKKMRRGLLAVMMAVTMAASMAAAPASALTDEAPSEPEAVVEVQEPESISPAMAEVQANVAASEEAAPPDSRQTHPETGDPLAQLRETHPDAENAAGAAETVTAETEECLSEAKSAYDAAVTTAEDAQAALEQAEEAEAAAQAELAEKQAASKTPAGPETDADADTPAETADADVVPAPKATVYPLTDTIQATLQDGVLTISGTGDMPDFGCNSNKAPWLSGLSTTLSIKSVVVEDGITGIGAYSFTGCSVENVSLGNDLTTVGDHAFFDCQHLTDVELPASVTDIDGYSFAQCRNLADVALPDGVLHIGDFAFESTALSAVSIPSGIQRLGTGVFYRSALRSVDMPEALTGIPDSTFGGCYSLESIVIPNSVTVIGSSAFIDCKKLLGVDLPGGVTTIGDYAFRCCSTMETITIPANVTTIGQWAFESDSSLRNVEFLGSAPTIGWRAFGGVTATATYIPDNSWTADVLQDYEGKLTWQAVETEHQHNWSDWEETTAPTADTPGTDSRVCADCGETETRSTHLPDQHVWDEGIVTRPYTVCEDDPDNITWEDGVITYTCTVCGETREDVLRADFPGREALEEKENAKKNEEPRQPDASSDTQSSETQPAVYEVLDGADSVWPGSGSLSVRVSADVEQFRFVSVDGGRLSPNDYTVTPGSTVVTLKESYLDTLAEGEHGMVVFFSDGEAETSFHVGNKAEVHEPGNAAEETENAEQTAGEESDSSAGSGRTDSAKSAAMRSGAGSSVRRTYSAPKTGDRTPIGLYIGLSVASVLGLVGLAMTRRTRKECEQ